MILDALWMKQADCQFIDPEVFFPEADTQPELDKASRPAQLICYGCDVRVECLEVALTIPSTVGVWGGTTQKQRAAILRRQRVAA